MPQAIFVGQPILAAAGFQPALFAGGRRRMGGRLSICGRLLWIPPTLLQKLWGANCGGGRLLAYAGEARRLAHGPAQPPERRLQARLPAPQLNSTAG